MRDPPEPKRIKKRIMGVENELGWRLKIPSWNITSTLNNKTIPLEMQGPDTIGIMGSPLRLIYRNQTQFYLDTNNHFEGSSPESLGAGELVLFETAGLKLISRGIGRLNRFFEGLGLEAFKSNRNCDWRNQELFQASWGSHANYLTLRKMIGDRLLPIIPFLLTRLCLIGNGWLEIFDKKYIRFLLSQRAEAMTALTGSSTTEIIKPLISTRDIPRADINIWRRYHDISGNSNMSEWQLFLKYGLFDLMLAMLETDNFLPDVPGFNFKNLKEAVHFFNADLYAGTPIALEDGRQWSALDFQRFFIEQAHRLFAEGRATLTPERKLALKFWIKITDALACRDLKFLAKFLDWAAILYYIIQPLFSRLDLDPLAFSCLPNTCSTFIPLDFPVQTKRSKEKLIDYLLQLIVEYANVDTSVSPYGILLRKGLIRGLFPERMKEWATTNPPLHTRANWRKEIISWVENSSLHEPIKLSSLTWENVAVQTRGAYRTITNLNPYLARAREIEQGRSQDLLEGAIKVPQVRENWGS